MIGPDIVGVVDDEPEHLCASRVTSVLEIGG
jgi:hypothetical protein